MEDFKKFESVVTGNTDRDATWIKVNGKMEQLRRHIIAKHTKGSVIISKRRLK